MGGVGAQHMNVLQQASRKAKRSFNKQKEEREKVYSFRIMSGAFSGNSSITVVRYSTLVFTWVTHVHALQNRQQYAVLILHVVCGGLHVVPNHVWSFRRSMVTWLLLANTHRWEACQQLRRVQVSLISIKLNCCQNNAGAYCMLPGVNYYALLHSRWRSLCKRRKMD